MLSLATAISNPSGQPIRAVIKPTELLNATGHVDQAFSMNSHVIINRRNAFGGDLQAGKD